MGMKSEKLYKDVNFKLKAWDTINLHFAKVKIYS